MVHKSDKEVYKLAERGPVELGPRSHQAAVDELSAPAKAFLCLLAVLRVVSNFGSAGRPRARHRIVQLPLEHVRVIVTGGKPA